jgi:hypothetical protein
MHFDPGYIGLAHVLTSIFGGAIALAIGIRRGKIQLVPGVPRVSYSDMRWVPVYRDGRLDHYTLVAGRTKVDAYYG